ncbi:hypothetical protein N789_10775 [Arenimonas oryziterrae DSM 21050 = YC6267]|uniref:Uncharacterized protein n=2 Tax=Arenimonas TaxID=490567 RepID=A0A091AUW0_9GAMM|nr:hypothetical protein N789_10775 [Arenimonas oryziterrae DSM 21050 = YC6267]
MRNPDEFVYVNQDGSVRELTPDERQYLAEDFEPGDGARPYIKCFFSSRNGWGSLSGFLPRKRVPRKHLIEPANPDYRPVEVDTLRQHIADGRLVGDLVTENVDGSVTVAPNPHISRQERFDRLRKLQLSREREREKLARHPDTAREP